MIPPQILYEEDNVALIEESVAMIKYTPTHFSNTNIVY